MNEQPTQLLSYAPVANRERLLRKLVRLYGPWATYMALVVIAAVAVVVLLGLFAIAFMIIAILYALLNGVPVAPF